jgi:sugar lactone lactonase YvrE
LTEAPRWCDGSLWFVDMGRRRVHRAWPDGRVTTIVEVGDDQPSGLGFLPDGTPLVVLMGARRLCRIIDSRLVLHADLTPIAFGILNDMVVDARGRAYVDNVNRRAPGGGVDEIACVEPDGTFRVAVSPFGNPNGMTLSSDGHTLTAAQTSLHQLTAFTVTADGSLTDARLVARIPPARPDGICSDAEGAIWVAGTGAGFLRVLPTGEVVERVEIGDRVAIACVLGGDDRRTLYLLTAALNGNELRYPTPPGISGFVEQTRVDVPGAGTP